MEFNNNFVIKIGLRKSVNVLKFIKKILKPLDGMKPIWKIGDKPSKYYKIYCFISKMQQLCNKSIDSMNNFLFKI